MTNITPHLSHNGNNDYLPYMNELEILAIVTTLRLFSAPISVLEWGSGNSTLYFSKLMASGSEWDSIEHNPEWANRGKDLLEKAGYSNIRIHFIPTNKHFQENLLDGDFETFRDYILYPEKLGEIFQIIFVDGRARVECMKAGWNLLDINGIMILHDAQRREYDQGIPEECYWMRIVNPLINIGGNVSTLFMSKSLSMITQLQQEIKTVLPKHIVISNNIPIFQPVFCDKNARQSQDVVAITAEKTNTRKTSENNEILYPKEFEQLIPSVFVVETVLGCNLKCPECAIGGDLIKRKKGWMPFEQFKIIADKIRPFCKNVLLINWGEPMLNKDIFKIIEYASSFTQTLISTNGQLFDEETAERFIQSGVTTLIVSIDGFSQEVYEKYRVGGNVQKALRSLKTLNDFNVKHGRKVAIIPQFVVFKHNQHEIALFREFCHSIGLEPSFKGPYIRANSRYENADRPEYVRPQCPDIASLKLSMKDCTSPRQDFTIFLDGTCVMCCHDHNGITNYGNIYQQDVLEIWNNPIYKKDRWDILTGNATTYCVENCLMWTLKKQVCLFLNWENTKKLSSIKLYAGDIPEKKEYDGLIGLSLSQSDHRHIKHDITNPLPLSNNSVSSYQAEDVFEHIEYDKLLSIINEIYRVLKPNATFRLSVPDYGCDVLNNRSVKDASGNIVFDPGGGGTPQDPGHVWYPRIDKVQQLLEKSSFGKYGKIEYFHYYNMDGTSVVNKIDYSKGYIQRTPDFDKRAQNPFRPMSIVIDLIKENKELQEAIVLNEKGEELFNKGDIAGALTVFKKAIEIDPNFAAPHNNLGVLYFQNGETQRAIDYFRKALEIDPNDRDTIFNCGSILTSIERFEDAKNIYLSYLKKNPEDEEMSRFLADLDKSLIEESEYGS